MPCNGKPQCFIGNQAAKPSVKLIFSLQKTMTGGQPGLLTREGIPAAHSGASKASDSALLLRSLKTSGSPNTLNFRTPAASFEYHAKSLFDRH